MALNVLFACGGTGGHVQPALAVAREIAARAPEVGLHFAGGRRGIEGRIVPSAGFSISRFPAAGMRGLGPLGALRFGANFSLALGGSLALMASRRPSLVLATGGYASAAPAVAAWMSRRPLWIQEQNSFPGSTNRTLSRFAERAFVAFEEARPALARAGRVDSLPNPVRPELRAIRGMAPTAADFEKLGLKPGRPTLFLFGGSRGAASLNRAMERHWPALEAAGWQGLLQAGVEAAGPLGESLSARGMDAVRVVGYIEDMAAAYRVADLVIGRAGALTLAELGCLGKAAILVPYPHATDDHQARNAAAFAEAGAALLLGDDALEGDQLVDWCLQLGKDPERLRRMESAMANFGAAEDGATTLAKLIVERIGAGSSA